MLKDDCFFWIGLGSRRWVGGRWLFGIEGGWKKVLNDMVIKRTILEGPSRGS